VYYLRLQVSYSVGVLPDQCVVEQYILVPEVLQKSTSTTVLSDLGRMTPGKLNVLMEFNIPYAL
jgi:hypothetical protein